MRFGAPRLQDLCAKRCTVGGKRRFHYILVWKIQRLRDIKLDYAAFGLRTGEWLSVHVVSAV